MFYYLISKQGNIEPEWGGKVENDLTGGVWLFGAFCFFSLSDRGNNSHDPLLFHHVPKLKRPLVAELTYYKFNSDRKQSMSTAGSRAIVVRVENVSQ